MQQLFGIPFYQDKIDPSSYDKKKIVDAIEQNYLLDTKRNNWDANDVYASNLHHSVNDFNNDRFAAVDFRSVIPLYQEKIQEYFNSLKLNEYVSYKFRIVNYTCMTQGQFLKDHTHGCDFSAVHYIKFNSALHLPTCYVNGNGYADYIHTVMPKLNKCLDQQFMENSWTSRHYSVAVEEDDFVIVPGALPHLVPPFNGSDDLRMTVVVNIDID